jgi:hypothetical protein
MEPPPLKIRRVYDWKRGTWAGLFCAALVAMLLTAWAMKGEVRFDTERRRRQHPPLLHREENPELFWTVWTGTLVVGLSLSVLAAALAGTRKESS